MWHARKRHRPGCLSGGGKTRKLFARARRVALAAFSSCAMEGHCIGVRPLSFGTRPWCDVRAVTSNEQPAFAWHAHKHHRGGCVSGGYKTRKVVACARRVALAAFGPCAMEGHYIGGRPLSFGVRPWCDVRGVTSNA